MGARLKGVETPSVDGFIRHMVIWVSTGIYCGYSPVAPGTIGTLLGIPLYLIMSKLPSFSYGIFLIAFLMMSCWFAGLAETVFLQRDSKHIVIDEIGGFLVTMGFLAPAWWHIVLGFLFFRFFDIFKPFPVKRFETLGSGYGVVADDVAAGIYSHLALRVCIGLLGEGVPSFFS